MLIGVFSQLSDNPPALLAYLAAFAVAMVLGLSFHEFCHAWSAYQLGDNTAARQGRLTLNPLRHLDPIGTIMMLFVGIGFARPTPVNTSRLRHGSVKGGAIVSAAGPLSNFLIAAIAALPLKFGIVDSIASLDGIRDASGEEILGLFLIFVVFFNVLLGVFNLIPIPPLDGFDVLRAFMPVELRIQAESLRQWGPGILMGLFVIAFASGGRINPLGWVMSNGADAIIPLIT